MTLPEMKWKKIEGASDYVPFTIKYYSICDMNGDDARWVVSNQGKIENPFKSFICESQEDAEWLLSKLNGGI